MEDAVCEQDLLHNDYHCKEQPGGICKSTEFVSTLYDSGLMSADSLSYAFDTDLQYDFRDNFLQNYAIGQEYIEYYYILGEMLTDSVSLGLMLQTARVLYEFNSCVQLLLDANNHANDILISSTLKGKILSLLSEYKSLMPNNYEYNVILDKIIADVNLYSENTVSYVVSRLQ
jgi:hypothetical protein